MNSKRNINSYGRFKDVPWFDGMSQSRIMVLGQGGIGSWLTLFLARTGANLITVDMDTVEEHNIAGQLYGKKQVGKDKVAAMAELVTNLCGENNVTPVNEKVTGVEGELWLSYLSFCDVVCVSFDNIKARQIVYEKWKECGKDGSLFVDGRMSIEQGQVFTVDRTVEAEFAAYETTFFNDDELEEAPCTLKATSHCGAYIACLMTVQITNWFTNKTGQGPRDVVKNMDFYLAINKSFNNDTTSILKSADRSDLLTANETQSPDKDIQ